MFPAVRIVGRKLVKAKHAIKAMTKAQSKDAFKKFEIELSITTAIYGTIGAVSVPELLTEKYGRLFSLFSAFNSVFVYEDKLCRISVLSVPTTKDLTYLRTSINTFCLLCDTSKPDWKAFIEETWGFLQSYQMVNLTVLLTSATELQYLLVESPVLKHMQDLGIELFALAELSENFINNFFCGILDLHNRYPSPQVLNAPAVSAVSAVPTVPEVKPPQDKGRKCLLM